MSFSMPSTYAPQDAAPESRMRARFVLPFVLALAILAGAAAFGLFWPQHVQPPAPGSRGSLVWGDGLFANRLEMRAWLREHNGSFQQWAENHPAALRLVP